MEKSKLIKLLQTTLFLSEGMTEEKLVLKLDLAPYLNSAKELIKFINKNEENNAQQRGKKRVEKVTL